ncbi:hypothetical protein TL16_g10270, partial [Triparma laevis f. inornata]
MRLIIVVFLVLLFSVNSFLSPISSFVTVPTSLCVKGKNKAKATSKSDLPSKDCVVCRRPFTWRKKWERDWDDITTCSKACNAQRKKDSKETSSEFTEVDVDRRKLISIISGLLLPTPVLAATADDSSIGSRTFRAVTQSSIGKSVRRDVVAGAQFMDKVDGAWEKFSDEKGLGSARKSSQPFPTTTPPPPPLPLNPTTLSMFLSLSTDAFLSSSPNCSPERLAKETDRITKLMRPAFPKGDERKEAEFTIYTAFRAFNELSEGGPNLQSFRERFELVLGEKLYNCLLPDSSKSAALAPAFKTINALCDSYRASGFISRASADFGELNPDDVEDWTDGIRDLTFSIPVDGDLTQTPQILLQEQGFKWDAAFITKRQVD